jgi:hypothetical protein
LRFFMAAFGIKKTAQTQSRAGGLSGATTPLETR